MKSLLSINRGFTLVELLIVIVVIGILAAITLMAYNGVQQQANNTTTIQGVKSYIKALNYYAMDNGGQYPQVTGCLGSNYPSGKCLSQSGTAACFGLGSATSTAINTALQPYMGNAIPSISMQQIACGGTNYIGAYASYVSASASMAIYMILSGSQTCPPMSPNVTATSTTVSGSATRCYYLVGPTS